MIVSFSNRKHFEGWYFTLVLDGSDTYGKPNMKKSELSCKATYEISVINKLDKEIHI